jgi:hypothetical protein
VRISMGVGSGSSIHREKELFYPTPIPNFSRKPGGWSRAVQPPFGRRLIRPPGGGFPGIHTDYYFYGLVSVLKKK